ncbi:hypothetical protein Bca4012_003111 [Brassica carinata]
MGVCHQAFASQLLPHNYEHTLYNKLHNLRQGNCQLRNMQPTSLIWQLTNNDTIASSWPPHRILFVAFLMENVVTFKQLTQNKFDKV